MNQNKLKLSDIHDCKKCHGKIVSIMGDGTGRTFCGYCGQSVDYRPFFKQFVPDGTPRCPKCKRAMNNAVDSVTKKLSEYLWYCECSPNLILSMG